MSLFILADAGRFFLKINAAKWKFHWFECGQIGLNGR